MKTRILVIALLVLVSGKSIKIFADKPQKSINSEVLFFDDFEEPISNDAIFTKWTTENLQGWHYWHIIPGQHMRFENTDLNQNDWLITKPINCAGTENLKVNFSHFFHANKVPPKLYYTSQYNGNASQSIWKELTYSFGANENQWYQSVDLIIENPGNVIYFAFHYQAAANTGTYFLLDNFSVKSYKPITYTFSDSSQYFTFYTTLENGEDYWNEISKDVDNWYIELCSYWDRPGITPIFNPDEKTTIYLIDDADFQNNSVYELPEWKCGYIQASKSIITKHPGGERSLYKNSYSNLIKNTLGQFILSKHFGENTEEFFKEAFGLFYTGYQPKRDSILKATADLGKTPSIDVLKNISNLTNTFQKDLITSFVEAKVLSVGGVQNCYWGGMNEHWYSHLEYYYIKSDEERIKLLKQTERFNIYAANSDLPYLNAIADKLNERINLYETLFDFPIKHRLYCVVYPTVKARGDCLIISSGSGGSGWSGDKMDIISKTSGWPDDDFYGFLIPHELFHVYHFNIVEHLFKIPPLYTEGLANYISGYQKQGYLDGTEHNKYKIGYAFNHYKLNYKIEPNFENMLNSQADENFGGYYNDPYYFGELFYKYFMDNEGDFLDLKTFFLSNLDYSAIGKTYAEIDKGYMTFLKEYAGLNTTIDTLELPFFDDFEELISNDAIFTKWTTENLQGMHFWHIIPWNGNPGQCMRFENTDIVQNDWLVTKPINCAGAENLKVNFSHLFHGPKIPPRLFYTNQYNGNASQSVWKELSYSFGANENQWYQSEDFIIENPGDVIYFAFQYQAVANAGTYFLLDNFRVKSYTPPPPFFLVGTSEHFEFYNNLTGQNNYYLTVKDQLENQYAKLVSIFNRPESKTVFIDDKKIKVYYSDINDIDQFDVNTPVWKSGFYDLNKYAINLSPINNTQKLELYSALNLLAVSELSQLAISRFVVISYLNPNEANFIECFGLYESGFRPDRIKTNIAITELGHTPILENIRGLDKLTNETQRNLCVSYAEACILGVSTERIDPYRENLWHDHLYYFYQIDKNLALRLSRQTDHFNIFCIPRDDQYMEPIAQQLEQLFIYFAENYNMSINHPFNIVIYPDEQTGMKFTDREGLWYNGGVAMGTDNFNMISPEFLENGLDEALGGLIAHEFFHVIHLNLLTRSFIPNLKFHMEGSADFNARHSLGLDIRRDRFWMIKWTFNEYAQKYNIELNLEHISSNPNNELDVYYLGDMFYEYLFINHGGYEKIKQFYINGIDYSVFNATYEEIDKGYINYLKSFIENQYNVPIVATKDATSIFANSALLNGDIASDGGTSITQRGFYWSSTNTSPNSGDHVELVAGTTGSFNKAIENLTAGSTYYFRAFAVNSMGTTLGEVKQFKTLPLEVLAELPFFADFEETIGAEGIFEKWTAENLGGWHYWHIIPWNGNPGQCMRFENTDLNQNDWLVTKPINCSGAENLKVNFSHLFHGPKIPPRLLYTTQYKGNAIQSVWKELTYSFGENENQWYQSKDISIENPGDVIYFAFHYQASANAGTYFLLDNFSVEEITTGIKLTALSHSDLKVYPNPKTDKSIVSFTNINHGNVTLTIYDLKGRKLLTIANEKLMPGTFTYQINKNDLPNGIYVVRLLTHQEQSVVKLIVTD